MSRFPPGKCGCSLWWDLVKAMVGRLVGRMHLFLLQLNVARILNLISDFMLIV